MGRRRHGSRRACRCGARSVPARAPLRSAHRRGTRAVRRRDSRDGDPKRARGTRDRRQGGFRSLEHGPWGVRGAVPRGMACEAALNDDQHGALRTRGSAARGTGSIGPRRCSRRLARMRTHESTPRNPPRKPKPHARGAASVSSAAQARYAASLSRSQRRRAASSIDTGSTADRVPVGRVRDQGVRTDRKAERPSTASTRRASTPTPEIQEPPSPVPDGKRDALWQKCGSPMRRRDGGKQPCRRQRSLPLAPRKPSNYTAMGQT